MPKSLGIKGVPRKSVKLIPLAKTDKLTKVIQPNFITYMMAKLSLYQLRGLIVILLNLKPEIENYRKVIDKSMQLDMLDQLGAKDFRLPINKKDFGVNPANYKAFFEDIMALSTLSVKIPTLVEGERGQFIRVASLIREIIIPTEKYQKKIYVSFDTESVKYLIDTTPGFTKYALEIALAIPRLYTLRMYILISAWKEKGGLKITDKMLRERLDIPPGVNTTDKNLYDNVIRVAYKDLYGVADVWFEIDKKPQKGEKEPCWWIKIISNDRVLTPEQIQEFEREREYIPLLINNKLKVIFDESYCLTTKDSSAIKLLCSFKIIKQVIEYIQVGLDFHLKAYLQNCQENGKKITRESVSKFIYSQIKKQTTLIKKQVEGKGADSTI